MVRASRPAGAPAEALLVRPDGHVAWAAGDGSEHGLREALVRWFGHEDWR
ncbi:hypothetical protein SHKM778_47180 [Streptomyces sp. KM77-8]|uniref:Uncharacterized protein n=1 Tax=Streptomyces haneummycinicus TaxID=3074435 RepID=A0AAT9HLK5_9ACTN